MISNSDNVLNDKTLFPNLPNGPLTKYRKLASFDWRKIALIMETEESMRFKHKLWNFFENHPLFARPNTTLTVDELKHLSTKRQLALQNEKFFTFEDFKNRPQFALSFLCNTIAFDPNSSGKLMLSNRLFPYTLHAMGTQRLHKYIIANENGLINGSYSLTEIGHGSNAINMKTTAMYDPKTQEFIINTPNFEAAKCWPGNLGITSTHTIVYAQLYTANGAQHHGLNAFVVQIRDVKTLKPLPGITVGDLGEKIGLNGVDNGFLMFNNYRIPRENLLAKYGDVTVDGQFITSIKDPRKRFAGLFNALLYGRVDIAAYINIYMVKALTIAIRYSASRLQFGPDNSNDEHSIIEYPAQQYRLIPHLATVYVQKVFTVWLEKEAMALMNTISTGDKINNNEVEMELHALSSIGKIICTWATRDALQDCREACGGHGYLKVTRIGDLRNDSDGSMTYEGDNNVLIQQVSNWLLALRQNGYKTFAIASPYGSVDFLKDFDKIILTKLQFNTISDAIDTKNILIALNWLCAWLLEKTVQRAENLRNEGKSKFNVRNNIQVFYAITLAMVYGQRAMYNHFLNYILHLENYNAERLVLMKLLSLYGANLLVKYLGLLYEGGLLNNSKSGESIQLGILQLLSELKTEVISLVDAIAPTDFIINSPLGMSDGLVYKHLQSALYQQPSAFERPNWWQDAVHWNTYVNHNVKGKL